MTRENVKRLYDHYTKTNNSELLKDLVESSPWLLENSSPPEDEPEEKKKKTKKSKA